MKELETADVRYNSGQLNLFDTELTGQFLAFTALFTGKHIPVANE